MKDNKILDGFHESDWDKKLAYIQKFKDKRFHYFGKKLLYQEKPDLLPKEDYDEIHGTIVKRVLSTNDEKKWFIDHAAAKFLGTASKRTSTVFARGNKRGQNYGTMADDGLNAKANVAILTALKACKDSPSDCADNVDIIKRQIKVIYAQATLRYAKLVGDDIADASPYEEHQAEGMAFFNVIYPWLKASSVSTADIEVLGNFFDVEAAPDSFNDFAYCKTKKAMETFLGADASLMGTLDAADEDGTAARSRTMTAHTAAPCCISLHWGTRDTAIPARTMPTAT